MEVRIVGIVREIFKRVGTKRICEEFHSIYMGDKGGACRLL